jgi:hypothetical protein
VAGLLHQLALLLKNYLAEAGRLDPPLPDILRNLPSASLLLWILLRRPLLTTGSFSSALQGPNHTLSVGCTAAPAAYPARSMAPDWCYFKIHVDWC